MNKKQKETITDAIAHLNGYVFILECRFIPALAVSNTIKELRELLK